MVAKTNSRLGAFVWLSELSHFFAVRFSEQAEQFLFFVSLSMLPFIGASSDWRLLSWDLLPLFSVESFGRRQ